MHRLVGLVVLILVVYLAPAAAFADETLGNNAVAAMAETFRIKFDQKDISRWGKLRCTLPTGKMTNMQIPWKVGCSMWEDPENAIQVSFIVYDPARKQESINGFALWNWKTFKKDVIQSTEQVGVSLTLSFLLENHLFEFPGRYQNYAVFGWPPPEAVGGHHLMLVFFNPRGATKNIHGEAKEIIRRMTFGE